MDLDATHEEQEQEEEEGRIIRHHELQHFHVLAVDDSQTDRKFLERLLTVSSNYHVTCVDSGDEALKYLGLLQEIQENNNIEYAAKRWSAPSSSSFPLSSVSHCHQSHSSNSSEQQQVSKVNLIMTDFSMPGMSGYDLLKRIKECASWKDIPVVVMSSENVPSRINMCLEGGAQEFLLKPVKASDLKRLHWNLQWTTMKNKDKSNEDNMMLMSSNKMQMGVVKGGEMENDGSNNGNCCGGGSMNNGSSSGNINMAANKRKASLAASSDRSRPRVVQELPVS